MRHASLKICGHSARGSIRTSIASTFSRPWPGSILPFDGPDDPRRARRGRASSSRRPRACSRSRRRSSVSSLRVVQVVVVERALLPSARSRGSRPGPASPACRSRESPAGSGSARMRFDQPVEVDRTTGWLGPAGFSPLACSAGFWLLGLRVLSSFSSPRRSPWRAATAGPCAAPPGRSPASRACRRSTARTSPAPGRRRSSRRSRGTCRSRRRPARSRRSGRR